MAAIMAIITRLVEIISNLEDTYPTTTTTNCTCPVRRARLSRDFGGRCLIRRQLRTLFTAYDHLRQDLWINVATTDHDGQLLAGLANLPGK